MTWRETILQVLCVQSNLHESAQAETQHVEHKEIIYLLMTKNGCHYKYYKFKVLITIMAKINSGFQVSSNFQIPVKTKELSSKVVPEVQYCTLNQVLIHRTTRKDNVVNQQSAPA
jgi:hypothetical protein